jgi:uncharacterized membrane protein HdeD (DUF308 family)
MTFYLFVFSFSFGTALAGRFPLVILFIVIILFYGCCDTAAYLTLRREKRVGQPAGAAAQAGWP